MVVAQAARYAPDIHRPRAIIRGHEHGLLGLALLAMLCAAQVSWLQSGGADAGRIIAAAETIYLPK